MPYANPSSSSSSTTTTSTSPRPHHHRTRSAFSDESGPGAFVSLGSLPRRRPSQGSSSKKAVFHLTVDDDSPPEGDAPSTSGNGRLALGPMNSLRLSLESGRFSPTVSPPTRIEPPKSSLAPQSVPFPTSSPLGTPTEIAKPSPFVPLSPHTNSLPRTPSTPIILSNGKPLKSSLKSSSSSPNVAGDFDQRTRHTRAQSAPSTPRVHFAEKDSGLETVRVFNKTGKPASLSKPPGEETETETEAESSSYPFPSFMTPMSPAAPSQLIHEVDTTAGITSSVPNPNHNMWANVFLENITLPRTRPPTLRGTVLVRNISFEKHVAVRFTLDDWQTTSEVTCKHVVSLPGLPPPFPRSRTVGDVAADIAQGNSEDHDAPAWDRFSFTIRLEDYESKLTERTLYIVARYVPNNGVNGEFWDNNDGANYRVGFRRAAPSPLTASRPSLAVNTQLNPPRLVSPAKPLSPLVSLPFTTTLESPTSQQRSFSAPSTMRFTPSTSASVARAIPPSFREPEGKDSDSEVPIEKEVNALSGIPPLARRHAVSSTPQFPMPPPISIPQKPPVKASDSHVTSPAQSYISRRLSLSNYVAPSASLATPPSTPPKEDKPLPKVGQQHDQMESKEGPVSPTFVLIGGMPASVPVLHPEPQLPESPDQASNDHCADSPILKDDAVPFSPTSRTANLSIMSSLEAQLGALNDGQRKTHMPSPPVSREASEDGSGRSSPAENESSSKTGGRTSPKGRLSPVGRTSPPRRGSPTRIDLSVLSPTESREGRVDTSDSNYAAFVRQWCFAQSSPPTPGVITASNGPSSASPAVSPSPPIAGGLASLGGMGTSGLTTAMSSLMNGRGNHHSSAQPRRQQAWPVEHQIGVGSSTGYGFPGFSFAPSPVGSSHSGVGSIGMGAGMSEGIVGGEFSSVHDWVGPSARGIAV